METLSGCDTMIERNAFRHFWYSEKQVLYELIKQCKIQKDGQYLQKEMVFLDKTKERMPVRCLFPFTVKHLIGEDVTNEDGSKQHIVGSFDAFRFMQSNHNMYLSVAYYKNPPAFSFLPDKRRLQLNEFSFGDNPAYKQHFAGYDFFIDFDSPDPSDLKIGYDDCAKLKAVLDHYQVKHYIAFSGSKGFHLKIPFEVLPQNLGLEIVTFCKILGEHIHEKLDLKSMDIGIFDDRRICKIPYSYDSGSNNICLPLDDNQFENFCFNDMSVKNVLSKIKLFDRGLLWRHDKLPIDKKRDNFRQFWKEFK